VVGIAGEIMNEYHNQTYRWHTVPSDSSWKVNDPLPTLNLSWNRQAIIWVDRGRKCFQVRARNVAFMTDEQFKIEVEKIKSKLENEEDCILPLNFTVSKFEWFEE
jgi:hypothetical protein